MNTDTDATSAAPVCVHPCVSVADNVSVRIDRIDLRLLRLPLVHFFETSFGRVHDRTFILVTVHGDGETGLGECVADADPFYSSETTTTAWHIISDFIAPMVLGRTFVHPRDVFPALRAIRGHRM